MKKIVKKHLEACLIYNYFTLSIETPGKKVNNPAGKSGYFNLFLIFDQTVFFLSL